MFAELKKMDANIKPKQDPEAARRLEIMRKARADIKDDYKEEKEANYQRRV